LGKLVPAFKTLIDKLSPVTLLNGFAAGATMETERYGPLDRQMLDVYRPAGTGPHPVVVFFYGGGWEEGERGPYRFVGAALAAAGIVAVIPDYRLYPEVRHEGFLADGAAAVRWAYDNAARFGGDPERLVLMGHSAGGYIAGMLAMDGQWLSRAGLDRHIVRGWIGLAGPYDFEPDTPNRRIILGTDRQRTQPIGFVRADNPPALLGVPRRDKVVDPGNATRLAKRIAEVGGLAQVKVYPRTDHASILGAMSPLLRFLGPVFRDCTTFIDRVTAKVRHTESEAA
jgi:acetyl esterase/lipase